MPWRLLEEGERIIQGDEILDDVMIGHMRWTDAIRFERQKGEPQFVNENTRPIRRRFTQEEPRQWQPIETCPKMQDVLLWADISTHDSQNWRMGTGYYTPSVDNWTWEGKALNVWDFKPTHWMHLPPAPADQLGRAVPLADASPPSVAETEKHPPLHLPKEEEL